MWDNDGFAIPVAVLSPTMVVCGQKGQLENRSCAPMLTPLHPNH